MQVTFSALIGIFTLVQAAPYLLVGQLPTGGQPPQTLSIPLSDPGAAVSDTAGNVCAFYQDASGQVIALHGSGFTNGNNYRISTVLPAGTAVVGSPLAAVLPNSNLNYIRLFFIGPDNKLKEYDYHSGSKSSESTTSPPVDILSQDWAPGDIQNAANGVGYGVYPGSKYLWAVVDSTGYSRVGYISAQAVVAEAYYVNGPGWSTANF